MFISALELFKIGIGPSSSHTMGPMIAAGDFLVLCRQYAETHHSSSVHAIRCVLKGSLAYTGKGHGTDRAVTLGLHGYTPAGLARTDIDALIERIWTDRSIKLEDGLKVAFSAAEDIVFDRDVSLPQHPNGMVF